MNSTKKKKEKQSNPKILSSYTIHNKGVQQRRSQRAQAYQQKHELLSLFKLKQANYTSVDNKLHKLWTYDEIFTEDQYNQAKKELDKAFFDIIDQTKAEYIKQNHKHHYTVIDLKLSCPHNMIDMYMSIFNITRKYKKGIFNLKIAKESLDELISPKHSEVYHQAIRGLQKGY